MKKLNPYPPPSPPKRRLRIGRLDTPANVQREIRRLYSEAYHGHIPMAMYDVSVRLLIMLERTMRTDAE